MSGERSGAVKGLVMASGDALNILDGYSGSNIFFAVQVQKVGSTYQAQSKACNDAGTWSNPNFHWLRNWRQSISVLLAVKL